MVFFTCNACGTALKKNQVEKHYGCSRSVSCVDCQKDFYGDEHKAHTKCISEAEKYNGPDWKAPSSQNKGERKQFAWVETVNSVLENGRKDMSPKQIALLNAVSKHDNVPRKKAKFLNFVKNITKNAFDINTIDAVWDRLEAEWKRQAEANKPPSQANGESKTENGHNGTSNGTTNGEDGTGKENGEDSTKSKKKSKKNKRKRDEDGEEEVDLKKKKKKGKDEESAEETEMITAEEAEEEPDSTAEFRWGDVIQQILQARDEKSIALKKLKKKVFAEYYARVGDSKGVKTKEDLSALLNKKLKKKKFKVVGETVKLVEVDE